MNRNKKKDLRMVRGGGIGKKLRDNQIREWAMGIDGFFETFLITLKYYAYSYVHENIYLN